MKKTESGEAGTLIIITERESPSILYKHYKSLNVPAECKVVTTFNGRSVFDKHGNLHSFFLNLPRWCVPPLPKPVLPKVHPFTRGPQESYADGIREALGCVKIMFNSAFMEDVRASEPFSTNGDIIRDAEEKMRLLLQDIAKKTETPYPKSIKQLIRDAHHEILCKCEIVDILYLGKNEHEELQDATPGWCNSICGFNVVLVNRDTYFHATSKENL